MKKILYILFLVSLFSCEKEDITPNLEIEDFYVIKDNPNDTVQHRRCELYEKYKVSIFFNDTIGKVYIKDDFNGNPYYITETLDLSWTFSGSDNIRYKYDYMLDKDSQLKALETVEKYLSESPEILHPFSIFIVNELIGENKAGEIENIETGFKSMYRTTVFAMKREWEDAEYKSFTSELTQIMLKRKIGNYENLMGSFNDVSKNSWYNVSWGDLVPEEEYGKLKWGSAGWLLDLDDYYDYYVNVLGYEMEYVDKKVNGMRSVVGPFGFIGGSIYTPRTKEDDKDMYLSQMFKFTKEEFEDMWGQYPLVMKKYNILYKVISEKIGIEL